MKLLKDIREKFNNQKKVWLYTGYLYEEITNKSNPNLFETMRAGAILLSDIVVDGQYIDSLKDHQLNWRGSSNQRIIDIKNTFKQGEIVLYKH